MREFVEKQVKLSDSVLKTCETKEKLNEKITKLIDHPRYDTPFKRGNSYFYFHNTGLQAQSVLYIQVNLKQRIIFLLLLSFIFLFGIGLFFSG